MRDTELLSKVTQLQQICITRATSTSGNDDEYKSVRAELLSETAVKALMPDFVITCRDLSQFWAFISVQSGTYRERREFIWSSFRPLLDKLELSLLNPSYGLIGEKMNLLEESYVNQIWTRGLERLAEDPDGAITSARTLLESICKMILDDLEVTYPHDSDLPKLYKLTADQLTLAPSKHTEQIFKQILGGCQTVVEGLGAVRNKLGDAHGQGKRPIKPAARHAELAVNLAGAMAIFLIRTWENRKEQVE
jgi:hypothetical protein